MDSPPTMEKDKENLTASGNNKRKFVKRLPREKTSMTLRKVYEDGSVYEG